MREVRAAIDLLGLEGQVVCCHTSMRSFSPAIRAEALIDALLAARITIVVPTFTYMFSVPAPPDDRPPQNAKNYDKDDDRVWQVAPGTFSVDTNHLSRRDMGAFPAAVLAHPNRVRGNHPLNSFTALGESAVDIVVPQTPEAVYAPLERLLAAGGKILMIGTSATSMTFIHLAEQQAGRSLFIEWALDEHGARRRARVGSCSNGFGKFEPMLAPLAVRATCLGSNWTAYPAQALQRLLVRAIRTTPEITRCNNVNCARCDDAMKGGPG